MRRTTTTTIVLVALVFGLLPSNAHAASICGGRTATIEGTAADDFILGTEGPDVIHMGAGNDSVDGLGGDDVICLGDGDDVAQGGLGADEMHGDAGDDVLAGSGNDPAIDVGGDTLLGGPGDDVLAGYKGHDAVDGGADASIGDTVVFEYATVVNLPIGTSSGDEGEDVVYDIENVVGSTGNDTLVGDWRNNFLYGRGGDDWIWGRGGDDFMFGDAGNDDIFGGVGDIDMAGYIYADSWLGTAPTSPVVANLAAQTATSGAETDKIEGVEEIIGSPLNDTLIGDAESNFFDGYGGDDTIDGRGGFDIISFFFAPVGVTANLGTGQATGDGSDTFQNIEGLLGSLQPGDIITGDDKPNVLAGAAGVDTLNGAGSDDLLIPEEGDTLIGGDGAQDIVSFSAASTRVSVDLSGGTATAGGQQYSLSTVEGIWGSAFGDVLLGNSVANFFEGGAGADRLVGRGGSDRLSGDAGKDRVEGGAGSDGCRGETELGCETNLGVPAHQLTKIAGVVLRRLPHRRLPH